MGRDGRKVENEIIDRYFERAIALHEHVDDGDREDYSPRPRRDHSGQNVHRNEFNAADTHHNSDPRDDGSPSVAHPFPPPYLPQGTYPMVSPPTWPPPSGGPYTPWQPAAPAAPARKDIRPVQKSIPPPPPPVPPPPPPPPPPVWPGSQQSLERAGEGCEQAGGELHDLLVSWYWAGYHAGVFAAGQKSGK